MQIQLQSRAVGCNYWAVIGLVNFFIINPLPSAYMIIGDIWHIGNMWYINWYSSKI